MPLLRLLAPLLCILAAVSFADEQHNHSAGHPGKLGKVNFTNSCSPAVQDRLQRAVAMLHSFWYDESARQFQSVSATDPHCAIAWWGVAMTHWHPLWEPRGPNPEDMNAGLDAIRRAKAAVDPRRTTVREQQFIAALDTFYSDYQNSDHLDRVVAYENKMAALHDANSDDVEATVFYALSLLGSASSLPADKSHMRQKKAGALVKPILNSQPSHPGVAHMVIHAYDYPDLAPKALQAARIYAKIAPESPHALHMPSHIFTRLGLWQESINSNLDSAAAARKVHDRKEELHARDYLVFAYLQTGQDHKAYVVFHDQPESHDFAALQFQGIFATATMPSRYVLERHQWAEAAALPDPKGFPGGRYAWADASIYYARAIGAARVGKVDQAKLDIERLDSACNTLKDFKEDYWAGQVNIQKAIASAWLTLAAGKQSEALDQMRAAVALDDAADKHPVTPGSILAPRDLLGQMLIEVNKPAEAVAEYEELLAKEPNRFAALYGIGRSAQLAGQTDKARDAYSKLLAMIKSDERAEVRDARKFVSARSGKPVSGNRQ